MTLNDISVYFIEYILKKNWKIYLSKKFIFVIIAWDSGFDNVIIAETKISKTIASLVRVPRVLFKNLGFLFI